MIRIGQLKLEPNHTERDLILKIAKTLHIQEKEILQYVIRKKSLDARKKPDLKYVYTIDVSLQNERQILGKQKGNDVTVVKDTPYQFHIRGNVVMKHKPIIVGSGPAGLFCAYMLARAGYQPVIYERGTTVDERTEDVQRFWESGVLNPESNVQFGEGGAGTFSDGKLNTLVKDPSGRNKKVLEIFVENGAPQEILYINKPHIGTDVLVNVVRNMRDKIISWGGEFYFKSRFEDLTLENGALKTITVASNKHSKIIPAETMVLAIGHSARDTFHMLYERKLPIEAKSFAVGVRVEHPQKMIDDSQYGQSCKYQLPAAAYKVTANLENQRGVYSFCMCPGGYVVNASSEEGHLAINGMSYQARDGHNANSAIIVTVTPDDFPSKHPLAGIEFQRQLERKAYLIGNGAVPVQRFADFCKNQKTQKLGLITPHIKGSYVFANLREIFPQVVNESLELGIKSFDRQIQGFANDDTILSGVESRTSSPVRILRNADLTIENTGIYPCGEGAGYAGGITSAAMDGIKVAEKIAEKFLPFDRR